MKYYHRILLLIIALLQNFIVIAQQDEEFIHKDKIYKLKNNWLTIASGASWTKNSILQEINGSIAYHFRVKKWYFNCGYHVSSDEFFLRHSLQILNDLHIGTGLRQEMLKSNFSIFAGPSYAFGSTLDHIDYSGKYWYRRFETLGFHLEFQYTIKIFYDIGIGTSVYTSINKYYKLGGIQLHLYFSGAFKKEVMIKD